ncbi:hypothetical protein [Vibrio sp. St2]|uniref:hypothetical protein n=1 Tax=Vibrio sp. St2 TaxID=2853441 RepID=UPI00248F1EDA|nr:hypothetical protein [Vibrio sp. St2]
MKLLGIFLSLVSVSLMFLSYNSLKLAPTEGAYSEMGNTMSDLYEHKGILEFQSSITESSRLTDERMYKLVSLLVKFVFSLILGGCALYIVLSKKYDSDTQKWAFSILSLISGVWIGTVS